MVVGAPSPTAAAGRAVRSLGLGGLLARSCTTTSVSPCTAAFVARRTDVPSAHCAGFASPAPSPPAPTCRQPWQVARCTATATAATLIAETAETAPAAAARPHAVATGPETAGSSPRHPLIVLGIESSCDDTGVAVVTSDGRVLGEAIATQADVHKHWGGVVPNLARDAHAAAIDRTVDLALAAAGLRPQQLGAIAVTIGPGLGLCLRVGAAKARDMARRYGIPLVSVHHMEAHALVARLPPAAAVTAAPAVRLAAAIDLTAAQAATGGSRGGEVSSQQPLRLLLQQEQEQGPAEHQDASDEAESGKRAQSGQMMDHGRREEAAAGRPSADLDDPPQPSAAGRQPSPQQPSVEAPADGSRTGGQRAVADRDDGDGDGDGGVSPREALDAGAVLADVGAAAAVPFPFLCLLISGGHNLLVLVRGVGQYVQLGSTVDDALGEAYDKIARLLNLELRPHGGAALEALAREGNPKAVKFAVPMRKHATCDFSFAGLKTNTRLAIEQQLAPERTEGMSPEEIRKVKADIAASFQSVAVTHLIEKSRRGVTWAREQVPELRHLVVAGGVACNKVVRAALQSLTDKEGLELILPPPRWCTDNGVMVAWAGIERIAQGWAEPPPSPAAPPLAATPTMQPPQHVSTVSGTCSPAAPAGSNEASSAIAATSTPSESSRLPQSNAQPGSPSGKPPSPVPASGALTTEAVAAAAADSAAAPATAAGGAGAPAAVAAQEAEWIELKPRWPLTSEVHPRLAAARTEERRSLKRVRLAVPLSDLTPPLQAQPQSQAQAQAQPQPPMTGVGAPAAGPEVAGVPAGGPALAGVPT